jgi:phage terminase large subunit-like protein
VSKSIRTPASATRSTTLNRSTITPSDFVSIAIAYAEEAIADTKRQRYGKWIRLAAKRFVSDLKRAHGKRPPFVFSAARANHACKFIERLPHVEGSWATRTIRLEAFQIFALVQLFGFRNLDGGRRFTVFLFAIARKNAKSTLAAAIALYVFCFEPEIGPQIFSAATTGSQARIVWSIARRMVEQRRDLVSAFDLEVFANAIVRYANGGTFRPINAKASTQDGLNPFCLVFDEMHAHKSHDLKNVLTSASGARSNPLSIYTTTEGYESPGPWNDERTFAQNVLRRVIDAEHYLALIFAIDERDQEFDSTKWIKANPLIDASPVLRNAIEKHALEAQQKPSAFSEFKIKRLNRRAESAEGWINLTKWRRCKGAVNLDELVGLECWAAFDLAATVDLAAWRLLWRVDGVYSTWGRFWTPADSIKRRSERHSVNYAGWVRAGYITETEGNAIDFDIVTRDILADYERFAPKAIAFDPAYAARMANTLTAEGLPLQTFIQSPSNYNPAMLAFEHAYVTGNLRHADNPVLTWNAANLIARRDVNMRMAPDKKRSADKIDGVVALIMAFGLAEADQADDLGSFIASPAST